MKKTIDMINGNPTGNLLLFSLPVLLGNVFQQLYNMADTVIVGRFLGEDALAAVGSTGSIVFMVIGFTFGLTEGFSVLVAQAVGARQQDDLRKLVARAMLLTLLTSAVFTLPTVLLCRQILTAMRTPENILADADRYMRIIFCGILCTMAYNVAASILRAMGDSRTPLYFLILSSLLNIGLDIVFILYGNMGVAGVAVATVLAQGICAVLCFAFMFHAYPYLRPFRGDFRPEARQLLRMLRTGIPMAVNQSIIAAGVMIVQVGINGFGSTVVAAFAAASKIENLAVQPMGALSAAISTFCGQNYGAQKFDRIYKGVRSSMIIGTILGILGIGFYYLAADQMIRLFVSDPSPELMDYARKYLFTAVWFLPPLAWIFLLRNALVGLGNGMVSLLGGILELVCRILCIRFLLPVAGFWCVRLVNPITWTATGILFGVLYLRWEKLQKKLHPIA